MSIKDGKLKFLDYETYYIIVNPEGKKTPLLILHDGPGSSHNHFRMLDPIAINDDRPIIMYDQLGCGKSELIGHPELFNEEVWLDELENLVKQLNLKEFHLLGHSWGGLLALHYKFKRQAKNIKSLILSCAVYNVKLWGEEQHRQAKMLPEEMQAAIIEAEKTNDYSSKEYKTAFKEFLSRHFSPKITEEYPACLREKRNFGMEAYTVAWGANEFNPNGNQKEVDYTEKLKEITEPSLIVSGQMDLCTPYMAKIMYDEIPNSEWKLFRNGRHVPYIENTEEYNQILIKWMNKHD